MPGRGWGSGQGRTGCDTASEDTWLGFTLVRAHPGWWGMLLHGSLSLTGKCTKVAEKISDLS